jgi:hypothetical protein
MVIGSWTPQIPLAGATRHEPATTGLPCLI